MALHLIRHCLVLSSSGTWTSPGRRAASVCIQTHVNMSKGTIHADASRIAPQRVHPSPLVCLAIDKRVDISALVSTTQGTDSCGNDTRRARPLAQFTARHTLLHTYISAHIARNQPKSSDIARKHHDHAGCQARRNLAFGSSGNRTACVSDHTAPALARPQRNIYFIAQSTTTRPLGTTNELLHDPRGSRCFAVV